jgi:hypothetical protein
MSKDTHIRFTDTDEQAIAKVKQIMVVKRGFPASTLSTADAVRFALLDTISRNGKKVK